MRDGNENRNIGTENRGKNKNKSLGTANKIRNLNVWYGNVDGLVRKMDEIREWAREGKVHILGVGETHVTNEVTDGEIKIEGFKHVRANSHSSFTGGVVIYIRENIRLLGTEIVEKNFVWAVMAVIKTRTGEKFRVDMLYRSPNTKLIKFIDWFDEVYGVGIERVKEGLILGDFNVRWDLDGDWGKNKLKEITDSLGMEQLITENTRVTKNSSSKIDLLFQWGGMERLDECRVIHEHKISDHSWIKINIKGEGIGPNRISREWVKYNIDREKLKVVLNDVHEKEGNYNVNELCRELNEKSNECVYVEKKIKRVRRVRWWDVELRNLRIDRDGCYLKWKESKKKKEKDEYWKTYKKK